MSDSPNKTRALRWRLNIRTQDSMGHTPGDRRSAPQPSGKITGMLRVLILSILCCGGLMSASEFDQAQAARFARLALDCIHKEYPNKIAHSLNSDADVKPPRELTPAFYGCFDWHSSVPGHWLLARLLSLAPQCPLAPDARRARANSRTPANIGKEVKYLDATGRGGFERPYGLAWVLQ